MFLGHSREIQTSHPDWTGSTLVARQKKSDTNVWWGYLLQSVQNGSFAVLIAWIEIRVFDSAARHLLIWPFKEFEITLQSQSQENNRWGLFPDRMKCILLPLIGSCEQKLLKTLRMVPHKQLVVECGGSFWCEHTIKSSIICVGCSWEFVAPHFGKCCCISIPLSLYTKWLISLSETCFNYRNYCCSSTSQNSSTGSLNDSGPLKHLMEAHKLRTKEIFLKFILALIAFEESHET